MSRPAVVLLALLAGCAHDPYVVRYEKDGEITFEFLEYVMPDICVKQAPDCQVAAPGQPCTSACQYKVGGVNFLHFTPVGGPDRYRHERAHRDGMTHTTWEKLCATVTAPGGIYKVGQRICVVGQTERIN